MSECCPDGETVHCGSTCCHCGWRNWVQPDPPYDSLLEWFEEEAMPAYLSEGERTRIAIDCVGIAEAWHAGGDSHERAGQ